jgi:hypothetical protein
MGTRAKFAKWFKDGKLYRVQPPDWPRQCELSFTDQADMQEWAKAAHVMLKDGNVPRREQRHARYYAAEV